MTDDMFRTQIRFPANLANRLKELAKESGESFNAEIVSRLDKSVAQEQLQTVEILSAADAFAIAENGLKTLRDEFLARFMAEIKSQAQYGKLKIPLINDYGNNWDEDELKGVVRWVGEKLVSLGFGVVIGDNRIEVDIRPETPKLYDDTEIPF